MTRRRTPLVLVSGVAVLATATAVALLAPWLAPHDPRALTGEPLTGPSARHLLGTNDIGQDVLSQLVWGTRLSLAVAVPAAGLALAVATVVGTATGLRGGWADVVAMRTVDAFLALPGLPLVLLVAALLDPGPAGVAVIVGVVGWPPVARMLRAQTLSVRQRGYVAAAGGLGGSTAYLVRRHVLPALGPLVVAGFLQWAATAVLLEAGLAFLGVGDPTATSWGRMLDRAVAEPGWHDGWRWTWLLLPPGLAVSAVVGGFTLVGLGLEPVLNPRWRRVA